VRSLRASPARSNGRSAFVIVAPDLASPSPQTAPQAFRLVAESMLAPSGRPMKNIDESRSPQPQSRAEPSRAVPRRLRPVRARARSPRRAAIL